MSNFIHKIRPHHWLVLLFLLVYGLSFPLIVIEKKNVPVKVNEIGTTNTFIYQLNERYRGYEAFSICFHEFADHLYDFWKSKKAICWLANPLGWLAAIFTLCHFPRIALIYSVIAVALCFVVLFDLDTVPPDQPGWYVWLTSFVILALGNLLLARKKRLMQRP